MMIWFFCPGVLGQPFFWVAGDSDLDSSRLPPGPVAVDGHREGLVRPLKESGVRCGWPAALAEKNHIVGDIREHQKFIKPYIWKN